MHMALVNFLIVLFIFKGAWVSDCNVYDSKTKPQHTTKKHMLKVICMDRCLYILNMNGTITMGALQAYTTVLLNSTSTETFYFFSSLTFCCKCYSDCVVCMGVGRSVLVGSPFIYPRTYNILFILTGNIIQFPSKFIYVLIFFLPFFVCCCCSHLRKKMPLTLADVFLK